MTDEQKTSVERAYDDIRARIEATRASFLKAGVDAAAIRDSGVVMELHASIKVVHERGWIQTIPLSVPADDAE